MSLLVFRRLWIATHEKREMEHIFVVFISLILLPPVSFHLIFVVLICYFTTCVSNRIRNEGVVSLANVPVRCRIGKGDRKQISTRKIRTDVKGN